MNKIQVAKDKARLKSFSIELKNYMPTSEKWFRNLYDKHFIHNKDLFNQPFNNKYISDVTNHKYRYIIEIDGSYHDLPEQKIKDKIKDKFYKSKGYWIFRLKAYDIDCYLKLIKNLSCIRPYDNLSHTFEVFRKQNS